MMMTLSKTTKAVIAAAALLGATGLTAVAVGAVGGGKPDPEAMSARDRAAAAAAGEHPVSKADLDKRPQSAGTWQTGIIAVRQSPVPGFAQVNEWDGYSKGVPTAVHAGSVTNADSAPSTIGELVITDNPNLKGIEHVDYVKDAAAPGPFEIVNEAGNVLTVVGSDGTRFGFEVDSHTIVPANS